MRTAAISVCTSGSCCRDGARATLVELEELASIVGSGCTVDQYNCFGHCGRGPNVAIDWSDGSEEMVCGVSSSEQALELIERATGQKPTHAHLPARLRDLRRIALLEQKLVDVQTIVE
jgi:NADH:ubiquinone oxidoreductase subunit E